MLRPNCRRYLRYEQCTCTDESDRCSMWTHSVLVRDTTRPSCHLSDRRCCKLLYTMCCQINGCTVSTQEQLGIVHVAVALAVCIEWLDRANGTIKPQCCSSQHTFEKCSLPVTLLLLLRVCFRSPPRWASVEDVPYDAQGPRNFVDCGVFVAMYAALLFRGCTPSIMKPVCSTRVLLQYTAQTYKVPFTQSRLRGMLLRVVQHSSYFPSTTELLTLAGVCSVRQTTVGPRCCPWSPFRLRRVPSSPSTVTSMESRRQMRRHAACVDVKQRRQLAA
jgi:hypothetical protein